MKKIGRFAALLIGMIMILNVLPVTGVAAGEKANIGSEVVLTPNSTSAYVLFGKEITGRYMTRCGMKILKWTESKQEKCMFRTMCI